MIYNSIIYPCLHLKICWNIQKYVQEMLNCFLYAKRTLFYVYSILHISIYHVYSTSRGTARIDLSCLCRQGMRQGSEGGTGHSPVYCRQGWEGGTGHSPVYCRLRWEDGTGHTPLYWRQGSHGTLLADLMSIWIINAIKLIHSFLMCVNYLCTKEWCCNVKHRIKKRYFIIFADCICIQTICRSIIHLQNHNFAYML